MGALRAHELRQGPAGTGGTCLARGRARAVPRRPGGRLRVSRCLELSEAALRATNGDEAEVVVHAERSGVARFAASIVHQPTLLQHSVVRVRVNRAGKIGWAATNRLDGESLADVARRAGEAADSARPDPAFPGFAPPAQYRDVGGYDGETAAL